ncbi:MULTISPECIES: DinB family protein [Chryseobacterium]|uniref:Damage-inducible protein DinB n=1 Tax=Chryseobacterium geocarposphaerae TaxID=1416776 RepID=A0ABU1LE36_9FLAO|nr:MULTISPECIES: DinB family protein [Chryseobacterium]MDR6404978.1 putative damage-inducible protein DinB [Chryseobacterium geocarposphaerae]MDR6697761.1 putative damage-inducible protein DinB [Chryseobacterium ginsenosidimutans]
MIAESLKSLFTRDLNKLKTEIESYQNEETIWKTDKNILNSAGNLCLHLVGNLNHFIGAQLGNSGYIRNRDLEFSLKNIPRAELIQQIESTIEVINSSLGNLSAEDMEKEYPLEALGYKMTTEYFLIHLLGHLEYHLGQINYHRRLLDVE